MVGGAMCPPSITITNDAINRVDITPSMEAVGVAALDWARGALSENETVRAVYTAMETERLRLHAETASRHQGETGPQDGAISYASQRSYPSDFE